MEFEEKGIVTCEKKLPIDVSVVIINLMLISDKSF
jgi:hypothetical protein